MPTTRSFLYTTKLGQYTEDTIAFGDETPRKIKKVVSDFADNGVDAMQIVPSMYLFVPNFNETVAPLTGYVDPRGEPLVSMHWYYGFDLDCNDETQIRVQDALQGGLQKLELTGEDGTPAFFHLL